MVKISKLTFSPVSQQLHENGSDAIDTSMNKDRKDEENRYDQSEEGKKSFLEKSDQSTMAASPCG